MSNYTLQSLATILAGEIVGNGEREVFAEVSSSSSNKFNSGVFVAISGAKFDGHNFILDAIQNGASVVVGEKKEAIKNCDGIIVRDSREAYSKLCALFNGKPTKKMKIVGVTGTNGKTTIHWIVYHILKHLQKKVFRVGTIGYEGPEMFSNDSLTTPDALVLHKLFNEALSHGVEYGVMEVSSHALSQYRVNDVLFDAVIFTNLTRDHLDYHVTMDNYYLAKRKLFELLANNEKQPKVAIINCNDEYGVRLVDYCKSIDLPFISYGENEDATWRISDFSQDFNGSLFTLTIGDKKYSVKTKMIGMHNVYNSVAAIAACCHLGISIEDVLHALENISVVCGRLEPVGKNDIGVYVDYAHTPDALLHALETLRALNPKKLTVVFGCGGDRDRGKRPQMGEVAAQYADNVVVTSDNPRTEDPNEIIADILSTGISANVVEPDRAKAIKTALEDAQPGDIVLIAGKGHEDYQIIGTTKHHFSDQEEVDKFFNSLC